MPCGGLHVGELYAFYPEILFFRPFLHFLTLSFQSRGTHLNYYMFFGSYNRGRQAAGGISNFYATDAALCPSGQRHQPKFSHYAALHEVIKGIAPTLLAAPSSLGKSKDVKVLNKSGNWTKGTKQRVFEYDGNEILSLDHSKMKHVLFIENDADEEVVVDVSSAQSPQKLTMAPTSALIIVDGILEFDSAAIDPQFMAFKRIFVSDLALLDWSSWPEPVSCFKTDDQTWRGKAPVEQTRLNVGLEVPSQYAWYETTLTTSEALHDVKLWIESQRSNGLLVFLDGLFVGEAEDHSHLYEGNRPMSIGISGLTIGNHTLSILSESFGYSNLIGRFGNSGTGPKIKGITGDVLLSIGSEAQNASLVDGREWLSFPGLHGETMFQQSLALPRSRKLRRVAKSSSRPSPMWYSSLFDTPTYDPSIQGLFLDISKGRGHLWLNGKDLGRFWNITRGETDTLTQQFYFLPFDYLRSDGHLNEITIFDAFGSDHAEMTKLVLSSVVPSEVPNFKDEVSYPLACI